MNLNQVRQIIMKKIWNNKYSGFYHFVILHIFQSEFEANHLETEELLINDGKYARAFKLQQ